MGNALNNILQNRDKIRQLMAMDASGKLDKLVNEGVSSGALSYSEEGAVLNPEKSSRLKQRKTVITEGMAAQHPRMPRQIIESFANNPGADEESSVLDGLSFEPATAKAPVTEQAVPSGVAQYAPQIDYSLLKTIINEAVQENVKKYVSAMAKKVLSESKGSGEVQAIRVGKKFSLITDDGKIYEAVLKFKKDTNAI